jgi:choline dehydrogenase-like flavoprotein
MRRTVAIVGSGIVGAAIAYVLSRRGYRVDLFEKGPEYPYPHSKQFTERIQFLYENPIYEASKDIDTVTVSGDYVWRPDRERHVVVGGSGTQWSAITLRMSPTDLQTRTVYGYGDDWPLTYDDLEPYYCKAEAHLGVSGTDADNPFAPRRSRPFPLPPFELSYHDRLLADVLRGRGIRLHTTPQARTRLPYEERAGCRNFGACKFCPIGARYSPAYHLLGALKTGLCQVHHNVSVRRVVIDKAGRGRALVYQPNDASGQLEHAADVIVIAAGAVESVRLLQLSIDDGNPAGVGNAGGHLGRHFTFHNLWVGGCHYESPVYPNRFGGFTAQCHQFLNHPSRTRRGALKVEIGSQTPFHRGSVTKWGSRSEIMEQLRPRLHWRRIILTAEARPSPEKYVRLSEKRDRFGDPYAHVHYRVSDADRESYLYAKEVFELLGEASGSDERTFDRDVRNLYSGGHHMGGCRMGQSVRDSVVDRYGRLHGASNVFVAGGSTFVGSSGAVNPTLTMVALALRTADVIAEQPS